MEDPTDKLAHLLLRRILSVDGAMGTMIKPRFVAGVLCLIGKTTSISPNVNIPQRAQHRLRRAGRRLRQNHARSDRRRHGSDPNSDRVQRTQYQDRHRRGGAGPRGGQHPVSGNDRPHHHRCLRTKTTKARCNSLQHVQPPSIGYGCALGPDALRPHVQQMAHLLEFYTSFYPNGGLPT